MKVLVRKVYLVLLLLGLVLCSVVFANQQVAKAEVSIDSVIATMDFGASVRVSNDAEGTGIRFTMTMTKDHYEALTKGNLGVSDVKFGMFILPESYKQTADFTEENFFGEDAKYYWGEIDENEVAKKYVWNVESQDMSKVIIDAQNYVYKLSGAMVNIRPNNIDREFVGVGYFSYNKNGQEKFKLASFDNANIENNTRSMVEVAYEAYQDDETISSVKEILYSQYIEKTSYNVTWKVEGVTVKTETLHYGDMPVAPENPEKAEDDVFTYQFNGWDKEIVAVTGNETYTAQFTQNEKEISPAYTQSVTNEQLIEANTEIDLATMLGISGVVGTMSYEVKDRNGNDVTVANGKFTSGVGQNYYDVKATATNKQGTTYSNNKTVRLIVNGTYTVANGYVSASYEGDVLTVERNGYTYTDLRLYLNGLEDYNVGETVKIKVDYKLNIANPDQMYFVIGAKTGDEINPYYAVVNKTEASIVVDAVVCTSDSNIDSMKLASFSGNCQKHVKLTTWLYTTAEKTASTGTFSIMGAQLSASYEQGVTTEQVINANTQIDLERILGITAVKGTMSYEVTDQNGNEVTVTNGTFTSGVGQKYYDVKTSATIANGAEYTNGVTVRFIVGGTFMAMGGYTSIDYSDNQLTVEKNADKGSLTKFRLYLDGLKDYEVGDMVTVTLSYNITPTNANQHFLVLMQRLGENDYWTIPINGDSTYTFTAVVTTSTEDFPKQTGGFTTLTGTAAKHVKIQTWLYGSGAHVNGTITLKSATYTADSYGTIESVSGCAISKTESGNLKVNASSGNANVRLYLNGLQNYSAGDIVSITIKYVYNTANPTSNDRCIYGPKTTSTWGLLANRQSLIADNTERSITFTGVVTSSHGNMDFGASPKVTAKDANNIFLSLWLNSDGVFEITGVTLNGLAS